LKYLFITTWYFFKAILAYYFGIKKNKQLFYAGQCLIQKLSFRLPDYAYKNKLIVLYEYRRTVILLWKSQSEKIAVTDGKLALYDGLEASLNSRCDYLNQCKGIQPQLLIGRDKLIFCENFIETLLSIFFITLVSIPVFIISLFTQNSVNLALLIKEIAENKNLLLLTDKSKIKTVHWFCIYEKDANIGAFILKRFGIEVVKHLSPVPVTAHNKVIIADKLAIENAYQDEEINFYTETVFFKSKEHYMPESANQYMHIYANNQQECSEKIIGYYSHAGWLRMNQQSHRAVFGRYETELELLNFLPDYLAKNNDVTLIIYPHPKEKRNSVLNDTISFYQDFFNGTNYELVLSDRKTTEEFHKINLAISTCSTVSFERICFGYKTVLYTNGLNDFPLPNTSLSNICTFSKEELFRKIDDSLKLTNNEYYQINNLRNYTFLNEM